MQTIYIDISNKSILPTIYAKQGDIGRKFKAVVLENSVSREITVNEHFSAGYDGASGSGNYETIGERSAFEVYGNVVTVELAPNMLQAPGLSNFCLTMNSEDGNVIGLWNIIVDVEETPGFLGDPIKDYYPGISAVLYVDQNLSEKQKEKARANIGSGTGNVKTVNGIAPDENGNVVVDGGSGITDTEKALILSLFRNTSYTSNNMGAVFSQLEALWSGGEVEPDVPVNPEKTLTSISAAYSGGSVTAGTAVNSLTGIVVTAHYSDGTSATVTGYTLSGTIAEGNNTITVSYGGKTTTFTVTGVAESTGGDSEPIDVYTAYEWTSGQVNNEIGNVADVPTWSTSEYISLSDVTKVEVAEVSGKGLAQYSVGFYDSSQVFVSGAGGYVRKDNATYPSPVELTIPDGAAYIRCSGQNGALANDGTTAITLKYYIYK